MVPLFLESLLQYFCKSRVYISDCMSSLFPSFLCISLHLSVCLCVYYEDAVDILCLWSLFYRKRRDHFLGQFVFFGRTLDCWIIYSEILCKHTSSFSSRFRVEIRVEIAESGLTVVSPNSRVNCYSFQLPREIMTITRRRRPLSMQREREPIYPEMMMIIIIMQVLHHHQFHFCFLREVRDRGIREFLLLSQKESHTWIRNDFSFLEEMMFIV